MEKSQIEDRQKPIVQQMRRGVLEMCILAIISEGEAYPSDIMKKLKASALIVKEGTIYPLLTRLKNGGLLKYEWRESKAGPPRKYYRITADGQDFLKALMESWKTLERSVNDVIKTVQPDE